jgi:hypothetical protein
MQRVEQNLLAYVNEDLVPKMPKVEGIAFAAFAPFVIRAKLPAYMRMVQGTELFDGENVNVDKVYQQIKAASAGKWPIEMAGFVFSENDLDKVYHYLVR